MQLHWPSLQIRLGPSVDLGEKLRAAALVLRAYPTLTTREGLTYIDVSAPSRPAVLPKTPDPATSSLVPDTSSSDTASTSDTGASSSTTDSTATTTTTPDATATDVDRRNDGRNDDDGAGHDDLNLNYPLSFTGLTLGSMERIDA